MPAINFIRCACCSTIFFNNTSKLDKCFRNGFWNNASKRLFLVYEFIRLNGIKRALQTLWFPCFLFSVSYSVFFSQCSFLCFSVLFFAFPSFFRFFHIFLRNANSVFYILNIFQRYMFLKPFDIFLKLYISFIRLCL